ncbi:hypothetical protein ACROYT_G015153 [Oculina patagonica]
MSPEKSAKMIDGSEKHVNCWSRIKFQDSHFTENLNKN